MVVKQLLKIATGTALLALLVAKSPAFASDVAAPDRCGLKAAVWGNYNFSQYEFDDGLSGESEGHGPSVTGAGLLTCGAWNIQLNAGLGASFAEEENIDSQSLGASAGSKMFWRDQALGTAGAFVSYDFTHFEEEDPFDNDHIDLDTYTIGLFGQYFADESLTLGLSGGFSWNDATDESGPGSFDAGETDVWFVSAAAKYYATPQFALAINGGFSHADLWDSVLVTETISLRGGAEYLFKDCGLSIFAGGGADFYSFEFEGDEGPGAEFDARGFTVFAGLRYDFGPVNSLAERDRTGAVNLSLLP